MASGKGGQICTEMYATILSSENNPLRSGINFPGHLRGRGAEGWIFMPIFPKVAALARFGPSARTSPLARMSYWCIFKFVCGKIWSIRNLMSHFFLLLAISYHKAYCMKHVEQCWMVCSSCCMLQWNNGNLNMHVDWTGHKFFGTWKLFPIFLIKTWWMM